MRRSSVLAITLGLVLAAGTLPSQSPIDLKKKVPPGTLLYASLPDLMQSAKDFQSMPLAKLWREKEVQEFLAQPLAFAKAQWTKAVGQLQKLHEMGLLPVTAEKILSLRPGNLTFALIGPGGKGEPIRFALTLGISQGVEVADELVQAGLKELRDKLQELQAKIKDGTADPMEQMEWKMFPKPCRIGSAQAIVANSNPTGSDSGYTSLTFAYTQGALLVASSKSLAERILGNKPGACLATDPVFHQTMARVKSQGAEALFFVRPQKMIQAILDLLPGLSPQGADFFQEHGKDIQAALDKTGLLGCEAFAAVTTYDQGKCYWDGYLLAPAPRKGFLNLAQESVLDTGHLAWIPRKATRFSMGYISLGKIVHTLLEAAGTADPRIDALVRNTLAQLKGKLGLDVQKDFLDQFTGEVITYSIASSNLMSPGTMVCLAKVADPDKVLNSLETLLGLTKGKISLQATKDQATGTDLWELQMDISQFPPRSAMILGNLTAFIKPTFTFHKGYLVAGLNPRDVKKALAQMDGKRKGDIRSRRDVAQFLQSLPPKVSSCSFSDIKTTIQTLYEAATGTLNLLSLPDNIPIDLALLPGSDTVAKHFFPTTSYSTESQEGIFFRTVSPFGPEALLAVTAGTAMGAILFAKIKVGHAVVGANPAQAPRTRKKPQIVPLPGRKAPARKAALPPPASPATPAQKRRVQEDFDLLSSGLVIYKVETGSYPVSLEILLKPTPDYPHGFLPDRTALPKDPWGRPYKYQRTSSGYRLWSVGPNGKDEGGKGDDILRAR